MTMSRRAFTRLAAGTGALAALGQGAAIARPADGYRASVGVFLLGGNDGWNMIVPTGERHAAYLAARGSVGIAAAALTPLSGTAHALHPAMSALRPIWDTGDLAMVLNAGPSLPGQPGDLAHHAEGRSDPRFTHRPTSLATQLAQVAEQIASRGSATGQSFFVSHAGYDTHVRQTDGGANDTGTHADLLGELATALAGFHRATQALGLSDRVTAYTTSDFGRSLRGNDGNGTDHGRASNQLVLGGTVSPRAIIGTYPGLAAAPGDRNAPAVAHEDYLAAVARSHDVRDIFPKPSNWRMNAGGLPGLFRA